MTVQASAKSISGVTAVSCVTAEGYREAGMVSEAARPRGSSIAAGACRSGADDENLHPTIGHPAGISQASTYGLIWAVAVPSLFRKVTETGITAFTSP